MTCILRHIALFVPDLWVGERYYQSVFEMELIGREALLQDGLGYTLPFDKGWDDAKASGIDLGMLALRKEEFVLALFKGDALQGQVYSVGLSMPLEEIARVRGRLPEDSEVHQDEAESLIFRDPYLITWQLSVPGNEFRTAGDFANRWLRL
jgi:hypothetical protein